MIRSLHKLGDRLLGRLAPNADASAEACWREVRPNGYQYECCVYAGRTYCRQIYP